MKKGRRLGTVPRRLFGLLGDDEVSESESFEGDLAEPNKQRQSDDDDADEA